MLNLTIETIPATHVRDGDFIVTYEPLGGGFLSVERVVSRQTSYDSLFFTVKRTALHSSGVLVAICEDGWSELSFNDTLSVVRGA